MSAAGVARGGVEGRRASLRAELEARLVAGRLELPPLPVVAHKVLALTSDPDAGGPELAALVHQDAGLAAAVLRFANSAALGAGVRIVSLQQAVARLGMRRIVEVTLATSLRRGVFAAPCHAPLLERLWRESLATALYAKEIARELRENVETAFLCGLLRRVGRPLALRALAGLPGAGALTPDAAWGLALELGTRFGVAAALAWELPAPVAAAIEHADAPAAAGRHATLATLAALAERLAPGALGEAEAAPLVAPGDPDACELNLYPESLAALGAQAPEIGRQLEAALQ